MAFFRREDSIDTACGCVIMKDLRFSFTTMFSINLQVNCFLVLFSVKRFDAIINKLYYLYFIVQLQNILHTTNLLVKIIVKGY